MNIPPAFNMSGNLDRAISLRAQARQFYNFIANQAEVGGVDFLCRSFQLDDGSIISVNTRKERNYNNRTGTISIVGAGVSVYLPLKQLAIVYPDVSKAIDARTLFSSDDQWNIPVMDSSFGADSFNIGDRYWVDKDSIESISWNLNKLYYRGIEIISPFTNTILSGAIQHASATELKVWIARTVSQVYLLTVTKSAGIWSVSSYILVNLTVPSTIVGLTFSDDLSFIAFFGSSFSGTASGYIYTSTVYRLDISTNNLSTNYVLGGGTYIPTKLLESIAPVTGSYPFSGSATFTRTSTITGWSDPDHEFASNITQVGHASSSTSSGAITKPTSQGLGINVVGYPKLKGDVLYGFGIKADSATAYQNSSMTADAIGHSTYILQYWEWTPIPITTGYSNSSRGSNIIATMCSFTVDMRTGAAALIPEFPAYSEVSSYSASLSANSTVGSTEIGKISKVYFSDSYYGVFIALKNIVTSFDSGAVGGETDYNVINLYINGTVSEIARVNYFSGSHTNLDGSLESLTSQLGFSSTKNSTTSGNTTVTLGPGVVSFSVETGNALLLNHLVVCIRDSLPNITGPNTLIRKTLIFTLNESTHTATLVNTLNYDIREYSDGSIGRLSVSKYPKLT